MKTVLVIQESLSRHQSSSRVSVNNLIEFLFIHRYLWPFVSQNLHFYSNFLLESTNFLSFFQEELHFDDSTESLPYNFVYVGQSPQFVSLIPSKLPNSHFVFFPLQEMIDDSTWAYYFELHNGLNTSFAISLPFNYDRDSVLCFYVDENSIDNIEVFSKCSSIVYFDYFECFCDSTRGVLLVQFEGKSSFGMIVLLSLLLFVFAFVILFISSIFSGSFSD
ncbi:hypothetical protein GEMRC1_008703 [Eukaryota sp. GEM-RC1]